MTTLSTTKAEAMKRFDVFTVGLYGNADAFINYSAKNKLKDFILSEIDRAVEVAMEEVIEIVKAEEYLWWTASTGNKFSNFTDKERGQIKLNLLQELSTLTKDSKEKVK